MKIRNGFISNSSSTSFIVALSPVNRCEVCGRSDLSIVDLIRNIEDDETSLDFDDPIEKIEVLEKEIYTIRNELAQLDKLPNDQPYGYQERYMVKQGKEWLTRDLEENENLLKSIQKAISDGKKVAGFEISYHNELLNRFFNEGVASGHIEILREIG